MCSFLHKCQVTAGHSTLRSGSSYNANVKECLKIYATTCIEHRVKESILVKEKMKCHDKSVKSEEFVSANVMVFKIFESVSEDVFCL